MTVLAATGIAEQFGLELGKLIAQIIVFGVVFFVLKKFAFGPIMGMLEQRRQRIQDGEAKLEKIAKDLAEAEKNAQEIMDKANAESDRVVKDADVAAKALQEKRQQMALHEANQILNRAKEAAELEHEQLMSELKSEFGRMVSDATARVTGKVLTEEDQNRINQEATAQVSA